MKAMGQKKVKWGLREIISLLADILTILGLSIVFIVGFLKSLYNDIIVENLIGIIFFLFLSLAGLAVIYLLFRLLSSWTKKNFAENAVQRILQFIIWMIFSALFLIATYSTYTFIRSFPLLNTS